MYHVLRSMGKNPTVVNADSDLPQALDFLEGFEKIKSKVPKKCDLAISFDTSTFEMLGLPRGEWKLINIDHHHQNSQYGDENLIDSTASSCTLVVYNLLRHNDITLNSHGATALYTGLVTDSGFFGYEHVNAETFEVAAALVQAGAQPSWVYQQLQFREPLARFRLHHLVRSTLELHTEGEIATLHMNREMLRQSGAQGSDAQDIVNSALQLITVEVAAFFREEGIDKWRISLRSKSSVDVSAIAAKFGGGGHRRAAGIRLENTPYEEGKKKILQTLREHLS